MLDIVYQLDIIQTVHSVALGREFCFPEFSDDGTFHLKGFYHLHLKNAVKNDWSVGEGNISERRTKPSESRVGYWIVKKELAGL